MADWQPIETAPRDGTVIEITALQSDGTPFEIWPCQWGHIKQNEMFAPGMVGMWMLPDGSATWREGDGGPTHWRPATKEDEQAAGFSDDAKELMCGMFHFGRGTVTSGPPHAFRTKYQSAFDELEKAGLVLKSPFNDYDKWTYTPSPEMEAEAEKHKKWYYGRALDLLGQSAR